MCWFNLLTKLLSSQTFNTTTYHVQVGNRVYELGIHLMEEIRRIPPVRLVRKLHCHSKPRWLYPSRALSGAVSHKARDIEVIVSLVLVNGIKIWAASHIPSSSYPCSHNKCWQILLNICRTGQHGFWNPVRTWLISYEYQRYRGHWQQKRKTK